MFMIVSVPQGAMLTTLFAAKSISLGRRASGGAGSYRPLRRFTLREKHTGNLCLEIASSGHVMFPAQRRGSFSPRVVSLS